MELFEVNISNELDELLSENGIEIWSKPNRKLSGKNEYEVKVRMHSPYDDPYTLTVNYDGTEKDFVHKLLELASYFDIITFCSSDWHDIGKPGYPKDRNELMGFASEMKDCLFDGAMIAMNYLDDKESRDLCFCDDEILLLSEGLLTLIQNLNEIKMKTYITDINHHIDEKLKKIKAINDKLLALI